jgi:hypothetical protein
VASRGLTAGFAPQSAYRPSFPHRHSRGCAVASRGVTAGFAAKAPQSPVRKTCGWGCALASRGLTAGFAPQWASRPSFRQRHSLGCALASRGLTAGFAPQWASRPSFRQRIGNAFEGGTCGWELSSESGCSLSCSQATSQVGRYHRTHIFWGETPLPHTHEIDEIIKKRTRAGPQGFTFSGSQGLGGTSVGLPAWRVVPHRYLRGLEVPLWDYQHGG